MNTQTQQATFSSLDNEISLHQEKPQTQESNTKNKVPVSSHWKFVGGYILAMVVLAAIKIGVGNFMMLSAATVVLIFDPLHLLTALFLKKAYTMSVYTNTKGSLALELLFGVIGALFGIVAILVQTGLLMELLS